jgi:uncharacterized cupin superfamily protein
VLNARDARWLRRPGRGFSLPLTGWTEEEAETLFPMLGVNLWVLDPGRPLAMYHHETEQEGFLVVAGEAVLLVDGQERPMRQWDYAHFPPGTAHTLVGAGESPCVVIAVGSRQFQATGPWGAYTVDEAAIRRGAGVEDETDDPEVAYARFPDTEPTRYEDDWLAGGP